MANLRSILPTLFVTSLVTMAQAFTQSTTSTWGPLLTPNLQDSVTQGETFTVTWDPETHSTDGVTVSLVLCHGNSNNCVTASSAIAEGIPAAQKSYNWQVPCDLSAGVQSTDTGYGMLIIVDGTGEFQYSTQFSVLANSQCSVVSTTTSSSSSATSTAGTTSVTSSVAGTTSTTSVTMAWNSTSPYSTSSSVSESDSSTWGYTSAASSIAGVTGSTIAAMTWATTATPSTTAAATGTTAASASTSLVQSFDSGAGKVANNAAGVVVAAALAMLAL